MTSTPVTERAETRGSFEAVRQINAPKFAGSYYHSDGRRRRPRALVRP